jgi:hypothetical protein
MARNTWTIAIVSEGTFESGACYPTLIIDMHGLRNATSITMSSPANYSSFWAAQNIL